MKPAGLKRTLSRVYENSVVHRMVFRLQESVRRAEGGDVLAHDATQFWGESDLHAARQEHSHWRGVGCWSDQRWLAVGTEHRKHISAFCVSRGRSIRDATLLEWGPGGGSNVLAFLPDVRRIYGVDISASNLDECKRQTAGEYQSRFIPILFDAAAPESVAAKVTEPLDVVYSTAVFQHFPSKSYGERVLRVLATLMAPGACGIVQVRYDDGQVKFRSRSRAYRRHAITFTSYAIPEFWKLVERTGFKPAYLTLHPTDNYAFYYFTRE